MAWWKWKWSTNWRALCREHWERANDLGACYSGALTLIDGREATIRRLAGEVRDLDMLWRAAGKRVAIVQRDAETEMDKRFVLAEARVEKLESEREYVDAAVRCERDTARKQLSIEIAGSREAFARLKEAKAELADASKVLARHCFCIFSEDGNGTLIELCDWHRRAIFGRDAGDADLTACPMGPDDDVPIDKVKAELADMETALGCADETEKHREEEAATNRQTIEELRAALNRMRAERDRAHHAIKEASDAFRPAIADIAIGPIGESKPDPVDEPAEDVEPSSKEIEPDVEVDEPATEGEDTPPSWVRCDVWDECTGVRCIRRDRYKSLSPCHKLIDPPPAGSFAAFAAQVETAGLTARLFTQAHWLIEGGQHLVNVYSNTIDGFWVQNHSEGQLGNTAKAIELAGKPL